MRPTRAHRIFPTVSSIAAVGLTAALFGAELSGQTPGPKAFGSPQQAADALIDAAARFDVSALKALFGPQGEDTVLSGEYAQDRQRASDFSARAREKKSVSVDPKSARRAFLLVGAEDWPFPIPIVKRATKWSFDAGAGRQELLFRRIGGNELDAIAICPRYVEAQHEYARQT